MHLTPSKDGGKSPLKGRLPSPAPFTPNCLRYQATSRHQTDLTQQTPAKNHQEKQLGGGFQLFLIFTPQEDDFHFDHIFQMGWLENPPFQKLRSTAFVAFFVRCTAVSGRSCWNFFGVQRAS